MIKFTLIVLTLRFFLLLFLFIELRRWLEYLYEGASALLLVFSKPVVVWSRWSVSCSLDNSVERFLLGTNSAVAEPDVLLMALNLILEGMINRELQSRDLIDFFHLFNEVGSVTILAVIAFVALFC